MSESYDDVVVLIPSHSLEDFPTELGEGPASSLLNAFAVAWHPAILASTRSIPTWDRADEPPQQIGRRLVFIPAPAEEWLPGGWAARAESEGATVVRGVESREDNLAAALAGLDPVPEVDEDLAADFIALGTCWLHVELLTRHMHHFSNLDEAQLQREAVAAAEAAVARDAEATRARLRRCFEALHEARERFYPVDCYLVDLCLVVPELADDHLLRTLGTSHAKNLLVSGVDLDEIREKTPTMVDALRTARERGTLDVVGGEYRERPTQLLPLESWLHEFDHGRTVHQLLLGRSPRTWGSRRFGLTTLLPQILVRSGFHTALHVVLDDGFYPDGEGSKERWEGCDGSVVDALSRIPLAGDSAVSFLRFAQRMAESMEMDQVAALVFARWPEIKSPWLGDFFRMEKYAPVLGKFVTFDEFAEETSTPGRLSNYREDEYSTPFLVQSVARREESPIQRYATHLRRRLDFEAGSWLRGTADVLLGREPSPGEYSALEETLEAAGPDLVDDLPEELDPRLQSTLLSSAGRLAELVLSGAAERPGRLVLNPASFARRVVCNLGEAYAESAGPVKVVQDEGTHRSALVEVPACGFAWFPVFDTPPADAEHVSPVDPEEFVIRNEFFEVHVNRETGGLRTIKEYGRKPNRLSQQLAFRFGRERVVPPAEPDGPTERTFYSTMRCTDVSVTANGPAMGEIVTRGELLDPADGGVLGRFSQRFRLWRGRRVLDVAISIALDRKPEGSPWNEYVASRFAWNDSVATLTRSVLGQAHVVRNDRIESLHYVEVASSSDGRTTIVPFGLPFHRKTGGRMLDTLLVVEGERQREFRFAIVVDEPYPLQAALDALCPPVVVPTESTRPAGDSGWFFHLSARNVQLTRVLPLADAAAAEPRVEDEGLRETPAVGPGFALRMVETEGRGRQVQLRLFRTPTFARQRDFEGRTIATLPIRDDAVQFSVNAYEIADIEVRFEPPSDD